MSQACSLAYHTLKLDDEVYYLDEQHNPIPATVKTIHHPLSEEERLLEQQLTPAQQWDQQRNLPTKKIKRVRNDFITFDLKVKDLTRRKGYHTIRNLHRFQVHLVNNKL